MATTLSSWFLLYIIVISICSVVECKSTKSLSSKRASSVKNSDICNSKECHRLADTIKRTLNENEEPCNDFYEFACGRWEKGNNVSRLESEINPFTILREKIEKELHELLEEEPKPNWNEALIKAHSYYKSCMDTETLELLGPKPALEFISSIGGWSICNNEEWMRNSAQWNVYDVLIKIQKNFFPASAFFTIEIVNDQTNPNKNQIRIDKSGLGLIRKELYFNHTQILQNYAYYMVEIARLLGYTCNEMDPEYNVTAQMLSILEFEEKLANLSFAEGLMRVNLSNLAEMVPNFDWKYHLTSLFPRNYDINNSEMIISASPTYLYGVANLIKKTEKSILSRYIVWQMLQDKILYLSEDFRKVNADYTKVLGTKEKQKRWKICTTETNFNLGLPVANLFITRYFNKITKLKTKEIFEEIKKSFINRIKDYKWLGEKERNFAVEKVDAMVAQIGYPSYIKNAKELDKKLAMLTIDKTKFFNNKLNIDKWRRNELFEKLRKPVDKKEWQIHPQDIDAMYLVFANEMIIPAGVLQSPLFYSGEVPRSLSYGSIGSIIGHEITHGLDSKGQMHDKNGDITKDGWSRKSSLEFFKKSKCFVRQYNKFKAGKQSVNGNLTLGENVADNGGSKLSLMAYEDYLKSNNDTTLPTLNYTTRQLFFISFAQGYCTNIQPEAAVANALVEGRTPSKFRVIGTLSNSEEFAEVFRCRKKSEKNGGKRFKMDPEKKCVVW